MIGCGCCCCCSAVVAGGCVSFAASCASMASLCVITPADEDAAGAGMTLAAADDVTAVEAAASEVETMVVAAGCC